jgi:hypothetical protein
MWRDASIYVPRLLDKFCVHLSWYALAIFLFTNSSFPNKNIGFMSVIYLDPLRCYLPHVKREEKNKGNHMLCECEKRKKPAELGSGHMWCVCSVKNGRQQNSERLWENRKEPTCGWERGEMGRRPRGSRSCRTPRKSEGARAGLGLRGVLASDGGRLRYGIALPYIYIHMYIYIHIYIHTYVYIYTYI